MRKKMSRFEHAILSIADPVEAERYEPYTYWEEQEMRMANLKEKEVKLLSSMKHRTPETDPNYQQSIGEQTK